MTPRRRPVRAFALVEILFCVFVASMIVIISGRLFYQIGKVFREVPAAMNAIRSDQQWLQRLRADAWRAHDVSVDSQGTITFEEDGLVIRWSTVSGHLLRDESGQATRWPIQEAVTFRREGNLTVLYSGDTTIALAHARGSGR